MRLSPFRKLMNMLGSRKPTVSFCIPCGNRLWQISQTLPQNLKDNFRDRKNVEFVLVDFASSDGLQEWVRENFREELKSGYLKYYYTDEMPQWHMCIAKNTPNRLANNDVLVSLDCDNFTGPRGGEYVRGVMWRYGYNKVVMHAGYSNGLCGRIALSRDNFLKIGGYDEAFLPWGYEDMDVLRRSEAAGIKYLKKSNSLYVNYIRNETALGVTTRTDANEMDQINSDASLKNIAEGRIVANEGKDMIGVHAVRMFHE